MFDDVHVAVVVPAYEAARSIASVLATIPAWVRTIVVVDDGSRDATAQALAEAARRDPRIIACSHAANRGVGAAVRTGYRAALERGAEIVAKMDSDGQMDPAYLAHVVFPVAAGLADYAKGSRFTHRRDLRGMPVVRLVGNAILSALTKLSSGYWNILDPTNGYTAISREALQALDLDRVDDRYFFESSMLHELGMVRAVVADVPMPARYADEQSHLSPARVATTFASRHVRAAARRLLHGHVLGNVSPMTLMLAAALPSLTFGVTFGVWKWLASVRSGVPATAGTVMLAALTTAFGLFGLLQALIYDVMTVPQRPLTLPRIRPPAPLSRGGGGSG